VAVSKANACEYCVAHHGAALAQLGRRSTLSAEVLEWAARLTRTPERIGSGDVQVLRNAGLSDRAILDAVLTVAYFAYANRLAMGLGLALEPGFEATCRPEIEAGTDPEA
jgi:AhpD family alkylhydroperoxidase